MRKVLVVLAVLSLMFTTTAFAASKIGVVNMQAALDKCDAGNASIERIKKLYGQKQVEIDSKTKYVQQLQEELNNQGSLLSESARQEKLETYQKEMKNLQRFIQDSKEELKRKEKEAVGTIGKELSVVTKQLGKELKYDLILEERETGSVYVSEKIDITDLVVDRYNKEWNAKK